MASPRRGLAGPGDLDAPVGTVAVACAGLGVAVTLLVTAVTGAFWVACWFGGLAAHAPLFAVQARRRRRQRELRAAWPDAIDQLVSGVRAGLSVGEALTAGGSPGEPAVRVAGEGSDAPWLLRLTIRGAGERRSSGSMALVVAITRLAGETGTVARLARQLVAQCRRLTDEINDLTRELEALAVQVAPTLLRIVGCAAVTAAKIVGKTAGIDRFRSRDAYARYNGTAPLPVWSSNRTRHRLSRSGNRQLNAALHRIALAQAHYHPDARAFLDRRRVNGDGGLEALRALKRRLSDVVYRALREDLTRELEVAA